MGTKITSKFQATIPRNVRKFLGIESGKELEWHIVKGMVVVDTLHEIENPVKFLTSQVTLDLDAVELVKESKNDFG
jgi:bifunctional DNA-binding transcriptional regulator/antitoxin component of YhaV-PrlF toxin-antitoxin module|tara:strand:+ start:60 stop:287 length:228 start_codon:yes stop_codon:yes gene_type:complete